MTSHLQNAHELWICECGQACDPSSPNWRYAGSHWEHFHGYPINHVETQKNLLAHFGLAVLEKAKSSIAEPGFWAGDDEIMELAESIGVGNVRKVTYDPEKHGEMVAERGDRVWFWGEEK